MEQKKEEPGAQDRRNREAAAKMIERLTGKPCNPDDVLIDYDRGYCPGKSQKDGGTP